MFPLGQFWVEEMAKAGAAPRFRGNSVAAPLRFGFIRPVWPDRAAPWLGRQEGDGLAGALSTLCSFLSTFWKKTAAGDGVQPKRCPSPTPGSPLPRPLCTRGSPRSAAGFPSRPGFVYSAPICFIFSRKHKKYVGYGNIICSLLINNTADRRQSGCELEALRKAKIW